MDIVTNETVTALARRLGNKRGWKEQMPAMPPGMAAGGTWSQQRVGNVVRLRYQVKGGRTHVIGQWTEDETPAAPSANGTGPNPGGGSAATPRTDRPQPEPQPAAGFDQPEPMILLTPAGGGAWRLSGYGVARAEVIRALRLSLVHLVAREAGALIIDEVVAPEMAVVATERLPRQPQPRSDKAAGKRAAAGRVKRTVSYDDLDDLDDDGDDAW